jgi:hypothetical protein
VGGKGGRCVGVRGVKEVDVKKRKEERKKRTNEI